MQQNPACGVVAQFPVSILAHDCFAGHPYRIDVLALEGKFRRVVQHEDRAVRRRNAITRCLEVTSQNFRFADATVVEKPIRAFRISPVLTRQGKAFPGLGGKSGKQRSESPSEPLILEFTRSEFAIEPSACLFRIGKSSPPALANKFVRHAAPCGSRTRTTYISYSRNYCKTYFYSLDLETKVVGN